MITLLALACAPATVTIGDGSTVVQSEPGTPVANPIDLELTFEINFDGDTDTFHHLMLTCVNECGDMVSAEAAEFDQDGWAVLYTDPDTCLRPHLNVWDDYGGNTNPFTLGETIIEEHGDWEANATSEDDNPAYNVLYLWVFTNTYVQDESGYEEGMLEPITVYDQPYFEGGLPPEPFNSIVGWEYSRPERDPPT